MKNKTPSVVIIAVLTVITIITWIFYEVYQALTTPPPLEVSQEILAPITPAFDSQSLGRLQESVFFEDEQITTLTLSLPTTTPTPLPTPTQVITPTPSQEIATPTPTSVEEQTP